MTKKVSLNCGGGARVPYPACGLVVTLFVVQSIPEPDHMVEFLGGVKTPLKYPVL